MVVLSDVWLDSPEVMDQLQTLFTGLHQHSRMQAWECCTILRGAAGSIYGVHKGLLLPDEATLAAAPVLRSQFRDLVVAVALLPGDASQDCPHPCCM